MGLTDEITGAYIDTSPERVLIDALAIEVMELLSRYLE